MSRGGKVAIGVLIAVGILAILGAIALLAIGFLGFARNSNVGGGAAPPSSVTASPGVQGTTGVDGAVAVDPLASALPVATNEADWVMEPADPVVYASTVLKYTNTVREAAGLDPLGPSDCATTQALARAAHVVSLGVLEHAPMGPVVDACKPADGRTGENLSRAAAGPADVVNAWLGSPGHRRNLLDPDFTHLGVGCALTVLDGADAADAMLCSQVFLG